MRTAAAFCLLLGGCTAAPSFHVAPDLVRGDREVQVEIAIDPEVTDLVRSAESAWVPLGAAFVEDARAALAVRCGDVSGAEAVGVKDRTGVVLDCRYLAAVPLDGALHAVAHELGHLLGACHVGGDLSVMWPTVTTSLEVTADDAAAYYAAACP